MRKFLRRRSAAPETICERESKSASVLPVVGWLVCVEGNDKGNDYRIHADNNFIGRSEGMDIRIRGDEAVAKARQAVLSFDSRNAVFYIAPGEGRSLLYVNGEPLLAPRRLSAGDMLEVADTRLLFVPLCGATFQWSSTAINLKE